MAGGFKALEQEKSKWPKKSVIAENPAGQIIVRLEARPNPEQICCELVLTDQQVSIRMIDQHIHYNKKDSLVLVSESANQRMPALLP